jgi:hypothetical protein
MRERKRFADAEVEFRVDRLRGEAGEEGFEEEDAIETC